MPLPRRRISFIAESSLSLLSEERLKRLKANGFKGMLPGIESWFEMGAKSKTGRATGLEKVRQVSEHVNMGPRSYARIVRLHNARRKLREERYFDESIGNIAAQEGFWDWSRFTAYYSKHFGELPSATRRKAMSRN